MRASILSLGEAVIDFIPAATEGEGGYRPCLGGSPYNVARALGRLDIPAEFGLALSTDMFGDQFMEGLAQSQVGTRFLERLDAPSTLGFVSLDRTEPAYAFYDTGAADRICTGIPDDDALAPVGLLHFGSIALAREPAASAYETLFLREAGGRRLVSIDPNIRASHIRDETAYRARLDSLLSQADIIKISGADLEWLKPGVSHDSAAAAWLQGRARFVVITQGKDGVSGWSRVARGHADAIPTEVVDTVGAGDSFTAGFLAGLHDRDLLSPETLGDPSGDAIASVLSCGQMVASATCARRGANAPWRKELPGFGSLRF
ncbi:carbohydrate kinase family protein [Swaminathania salitolerans]|uniref:Carbohydrate kinase n=1 Tax=Swaminathania salitolerans TaxID=182838 RepID=A0A511BQ28_9PROT|nr:carbohydrate kinase [Swaminathania salitolerans]GBQ11159.1 fructokinase [Swaminathania salitolerans LMG 21291]GEL02365.1 carbohydrate kinase [Swaminathania salitolerans]